MKNNHSTFRASFKGLSGLLALVLLVMGQSHALRAQSLNSSSGCTPSILTITSGSSPTQVVWELNGTGISTVTPTIATVAGGNGFGSGSNQFYAPYGLYIDGSGNVYATDFGNSRVQKWAPGATSGTTVAGGHGNGNGADQLNSPYGVFVDGNNPVFGLFQLVICAANKMPMALKCRTRYSQIWVHSF